MCRHACQPTRARREPGQVDLGRVPLTMRAVRPSPSLHRLEPPSCRSTACGTSAGQPSRLMVLLATMAVVACVQCTATIRTVPVLPDPAARRIPTPPRACPARSGAWRHGPGRAHPALPACRSVPVRRGAIRRRMPSRRHRRSKGLPAARWRPRGHDRPPPQGQFRADARGNAAQGNGARDRTSRGPVENERNHGRRKQHREKQGSRRRQGNQSTDNQTLQPGEGTLAPQWRGCPRRLACAFAHARQPSAARTSTAASAVSPIPAAISWPKRMAASSRAGPPEAISASSASILASSSAARSFPPSVSALPTPPKRPDSSRDYFHVSRSPSATRLANWSASGGGYNRPRVAVTSGPCMLALVVSRILDQPSNLPPSRKVLQPSGFVPPGSAGGGRELCCTTRVTT